MDSNLAQKVKELEDKVEILSQRRISQLDIIPSTIKNRHMGEANTYVFSGVEADLPVAGINIGTQNFSMYWCTDSHKLKIWDGTIWRSVTLA